MNDDLIRELLRELKLIRVCACILTTIFALAMLNQVFGFFH